MIDGEANSILATNHAFLLLSGFTRNEVESIAPTDFFHGDEGLVALARAKAGTEEMITSVPANPREGEQLLVDLRPHPIGSPPQALLLVIETTAERLREERRGRGQRQRQQQRTELETHCGVHKECLLSKVLKDCESGELPGGALPCFTGPGGIRMTPLFNLFRFVELIANLSRLNDN